MMRCSTSGLSLLLLGTWTVALTLPVRADNWPRFRGPNGTGIAADKDIPVEWTEKNVLWKVALPGTGNSSPVVWGDRLFVQVASPDGQTRSLLAVSTADGKILWTKTHGGAKVKTHAKNTLASSTPATDGERVYITFWDGTKQELFAYDFQGNEVWKQDLGKFTSQHGAGASPMVYDGKVYFTNDQDGTAALLAFDAKTGKEVWKVNRQAFRACYSTPFVLERPGQAPELIVASTAGVSSYDPKTGSEIWHFSWPWGTRPLRTVASPISAHGLILATGGDGDGSRDAIAFQPGGKGELSKTNLVWQNIKSLPYVPTMLSRGEYVYFVNDKGLASCVQAATGKFLWSEALIGGMSASPILVDDRIYAASEDGDVYVFAAEPTFKLLARNSLGEPMSATPAVANHRLYIHGKTHLFCIGKP